MKNEHTQMEQRLIKIICLGLILVASSIKVTAQCPNGPCGPELIPNGDLSITTAICGDPQFNNILYYDQTPVQDWYGITLKAVSETVLSGTTDYYNSLCNETGTVDLEVGNNNAGSACPANSGSVNCFSGNSEYMQAELATPLDAGKQYCISFDIASGFGLNAGAIFFNDQKYLNTTGGLGVIPLPIGVTFSGSGFGCISLTYTYCADGTEKWIIFGPGNGTDNFIIDNISMKEHCNVNPELTLTASPDSVTCANLCTDITATYTGAATNPTLTWIPAIDPGGAYTAPVTVNTCLTAGTNTEYTVIVEATGNCGGLAYDTARITIKTPPNCGFTVTPIAAPTAICSGGSSTITTTVAGGTGPFTYFWDNGLPATIGPHTVSPTSTTTYKVVVTDQGTGDKDSNTVTVTVNPQPTTTNQLDSACEDVAGGGTVANVNLTLYNTAIGGAGATYVWYSNAGLTTMVPSPTSATLTTQIYYVEVTDGTTSCKDTATLGYTVNPLPTADAGEDTTTCFTNNIVLTATGAGVGGTYLWSTPPGGGVIMSGGSTASPTVATNDPTPVGDVSLVFTVTVTDANGCTDSDNVTVTFQNVCCAMTNTSAFTNPLCNGDMNGTITLTATNGTGTVNFSINDGTGPVVQPNNGNFTGLAAGTYQISITDGDPGCLYTETIVLIDHPVLVATADSVDMSCNGVIPCDGALNGSAVGGTGTLTYSWDGGPAPMNQNQTAVCVGTYLLTVTDTNNCTATDPATVGEPTALVITVGTITDASCAATNGGVVLSATGGTSGTGAYSFDIGGTGQASGTFTGVASGTYLATVTDDNGCTDTASFTINELPRFSLTIASQTAATCNGICDGSITFTPVNGVPGYTYDIGNGPQTSATFTGLCADTSTVRITDATNCTFDTTFIITEPVAVNGKIDSQTNETCIGDADGILVVSDSTGVTPFTFDIGMGPQFSGTFNNLPAGIGVVNITDGDGCAGTINYTIEPGAEYADASIITNGPFCVNDDPIDFTATDTGGVWTGIGITDAIKGTYDPSIIGGGSSSVVTYTISGACGDQDLKTIFVDPIPVVDAGLDTTLCEGDKISLSGQGVPVIVPTWSNGVNDNIPFTVIEGVTTYTLTGTDVNGCENTDDVIVTGLALPNITFDLTPSTCVGDTNGAITAIITEGMPPYDVLWSTGDSVSALTELVIGNYTITVTDANGCSIPATAVMFSDDSECEYVVFVANVFSPNGDGNNDVLHVMGDNIEFIKFIIYNRWGNKVFESTEQADGWDGTFDGKKLNTGVFAFYVEVTFRGGIEKKLKGNVLLQK